MPTLISRSDVLHLLEAQRAALHALGVRRLGLFGSVARGEAHRESDVDLLVEFEPGQKTFDHFMQVADLLEEVLQRRVELVTRESLSPYIGPHILDEVTYVSVTD